MIRQILQAGRFDWLAYRALYPDIGDAGVSSKMKVLLHWFRHGRRENRMFPLEGDPTFLRSHPRRIIIDVTNQCNLSCVDCNRLCAPDQAPAHEHMHPGQIENFIAESIRDGRQWDLLRIEGGEPTQNPWFPEIVDRLAARKRELYPDGKLLVVSNGFGEGTGPVLERLSEEIVVIDSQKSDFAQPDHRPIAVAPSDRELFAGHDFSRGCSLPAHFGLGLTRTGFYPHPICGAVDRVFGFDLGRKTLPKDDFGDFQEARSKLCRLCGWYLYMGINLHYERMFKPAENQGTVTPSWAAALARFRQSPPALSLYPVADSVP